MLFLIISVGLFTKPTNDSFGEVISINAPFGFQTLIKMFVNTNTKIVDFGFFKTAVLSDRLINVCGIGMFKTWFVFIERDNTHPNSEYNKLLQTIQQNSSFTHDKFFFIVL
jgi:hypothetical protein